MEDELPEDELDSERGDGFSRARRHFFGALVAGGMGAAAVALGSEDRSRGRVRLRPPGALPEDAFSDACTRCMRCGNVCPNQCIEFYGIEAGLGKMFTPYIHARSRGCILCGECTDVCPTDALQPFEITQEGWVASVDMGKARVNEDLCFSYHGRTCGACYQACPLAGRAMTIGIFETPIVHTESCVGCGLCEQACLHLPQAIRVVPTRRRLPVVHSAEEEA